MKALRSRTDEVGNRFEIWEDGFGTIYVRTSNGGSVRMAHTRANNALSAALLALWEALPPEDPEAGNARSEIGYTR